VVSVHTEAQRRAALAEVARLRRAPDGSPEADLLGELVAAVAAFERRARAAALDARGAPAR